nr:polyprenyltransferase 1 [Tanacetum cinerariifolium]
MGGHGHDEPAYLHSKHMYNLDRMKHQKLTMTLSVFTAFSIGVGFPIFAVVFQQKKTASGRGFVQRTYTASSNLKDDDQKDKYELLGNKKNKVFGGWIDLYLPKIVRSYAHLARSITLAASPGHLPDLKMMALFGFGAFLLRVAGCTINDLLDRDIDTKS